MKDSNKVNTVNGIKLKAGQKWMTRNLGAVELSVSTHCDVDFRTTYPWWINNEEGDACGVTSDGKYCSEDAEPELLELISESGGKEKAYTLSEIEEAWIKSGWGRSNTAWGIFKGHLTNDELEYQQYLALKAKFEG